MNGTTNETRQPEVVAHCGPALEPFIDPTGALREAGFRWGGGSWTGKRDALPASVATR